MLSAPASSPSSQASVPVSARATSSTLKPARLPSSMPSLTLSTTRSARPTAANALNLHTLLSPSRPRTEPSTFRDLSLSSREFTLPREKELLRTPRALPRRTPYALPPTPTVASVLNNNALPFRLALPLSKPPLPYPLRSLLVPLSRVRPSVEFNPSEHLLPT